MGLCEAMKEKNARMFLFLFFVTKTLYIKDWNGLETTCPYGQCRQHLVCGREFWRNEPTQSEVLWIEDISVNIASNGLLMCGQL